MSHPTQMSLLATPDPGVETKCVSLPAPVREAEESPGEAMMREWCEEQRCTFNHKCWLIFRDKSGARIFAVLYLYQGTREGLLRVGVPALGERIYEGRDVTETLFPALEAMRNFAQGRGVAYDSSCVSQATNGERRFFVQGDLWARP